jgi:protocatechuate 3,4-dioxygenase beta subunit
MTRREALGLAGAAGVGVAGLRLADIADGAARAAARGPVVERAAALSCTTLTPEKEPGPYFVDVRLNRSDIRTDTSTGVAQPGIPLTITLYVISDDNCTPYEGAVVDVWNANALGAYSDEAVENSVGTNYLRGYQVTDANGMVQFTTNMPGWYPGRAMHIHVEVRTFDDSSNQTFEWQTQLFFGETIDAAVAATSPYSSNTVARVTDENDVDWQEDWTGTTRTNKDNDDGDEVTPALSGDTSQGYSGTFDIVLAGLPGSNADGLGGTSGTTTTGSGSGSGSGAGAGGVTGGGAGAGGSRGPAVTAPAARAYLERFHWTRNRSGKRNLVLGLQNDEAVHVEVELRRGVRLLARSSSHMPSGQRTLALSIPARVAPGIANLQIAFSDAAGHERYVTRPIQVPRVER